MSKLKLEFIEIQIKFLENYLSKNYTIDSELVSGSYGSYHKSERHKIARKIVQNIPKV
jgi:hypothetical protein